MLYGLQATKLLTSVLCFQNLVMVFLTLLPAVS